MADILRVVEDLRGLAYELEDHVLMPTPTPEKPPLVVMIRNTPLNVKAGQWTPVPMDEFYGGDPDLVLGKYVRGAGGYWNHAGHVKFASGDQGQKNIRFVRNIESSTPDWTGTEDWVSTPGRDYKSHSWMFQPELGKPTGFEVWSSHDAVIEYAQLKAVRLLNY